MLSDRSPIMMRVRISFDALRLCLLVAAGVTSGYLWRAAFESSSPGAEERVAATPQQPKPTPQPPSTPPSPPSSNPPPASTPSVASSTAQAATPPPATTTTQ